MSLDLAQIRSRLNSLKSATSKSSLIWKPDPGKNLIRIVPYKYNPKNPFIELFFHFELGKKSFLSPKSFGEKDPIVEFTEKLRRTGDKDDWRMARKLEPKLRTFVPIVVRGKENEGVKFWGFGKTVYESLLSLISEPDWGDITDPHTGRDIVVEFKTKEEAGKDYPETKATPKPAQTPLTKDDELLERLLNDQKEITEVYTKPTYEELTEALEKWLNPETDEAGVDTAPEPVVEIEGATDAAPKVKPKPAKGTEDVEQAFDKLFNRAEDAKNK